VSAGGTAAATGVNGGGEETVLAGGVAFYTVVNPDGEVTNKGYTSGLEDRNLGADFVLAGGTARATTVSGGGQEIVSAGGTAEETMVSNGGDQFVFSNGVASATGVANGGILTISGGGQAFDLNVSAGGTALVHSGATLTGAVVTAGGTLGMNGSVAGALQIDGLVYAVGGTLDPTGLTGTGTLVLEAGSMLKLTTGATLADLIVGAGGALEIHGVTFITDPLTIDAGGSVTGTGVLGGGITDDGFIGVSGGMLEFTGAVTGGGMLMIGNGGTLRLDGAVGPGTTIAFGNGGTGTVIEEDASAVQATILGLAPGDQVVACFAEGTLIRTPDGDVPVERLRPGDRVVMARSGGVAPVVWIGHRDVDCRRHPRPRDAWPVRVRAGAFGRNVPRRELWLSPDHAVYIDEMLIPIRHLVDGGAIVQVRMDRMSYWHVELPGHDILLAEGMPAESYLDTGNRSAFADGGAAIDLHADFSRILWEAKACANLVCSGEALLAVRARLRDRAAGRSRAGVMDKR
jgi:autotransporter passenger strand-loop-strand repeat protein